MLILCRQEFQLQPRLELCCPQEGLSQYPTLEAYVSRMWEVPVVKAYACSPEDHAEFWMGLVTGVPKYDIIYERNRAKAKL